VLLFIGFQVCAGLESQCNWNRSLAQLAAESCPGSLLQKHASQVLNMPCPTSLQILAYYGFVNFNWQQVGGVLRSHAGLLDINRDG
jgi:hypothetical protein